jgi:hypothetical protein
MIDCNLSNIIFVLLLFRNYLNLLFLNCDKKQFYLLIDKICDYRFSNFKDLKQPYFTINILRIFSYQIVCMISLYLYKLRLT